MTTTNSKIAALAAAKAAAAQAKVAAQQAAKTAVEAQQQAALAQHDAVQEAAKKAEAEMAAREAAKAATEAKASKEMQEMNPTKQQKAEKAAEKKAAREAAKKASAVRKDKLAALKGEIAKLKAKGAKMTDADKQAVKEMRIEIKLVRGNVGGKAKVEKLVQRLLASLDAVAVETGKYQKVDAVSAALTEAATQIGNLVNATAAATFKKPVKEKAAGGKVKAVITVGTMMVLRDAAKEAYADVVDNVNDEFRVVKVVEKKAVVVASDGTKFVLPLGHLKPVA